MAKGSWAGRLARRGGGAQTGGTQGDGQVKTAAGKEQPGQPGQGDAVVAAALAGAALSALEQAALDRYRSVLNTLAGQGGASYQAGALEAAQAELERLPLPASLGGAVLILKELFRDCTDVVFRGLLVGGRRPALLLFVDGMADSQRLEMGVLQPLIRRGDPEQSPDPPGDLGAWLEPAAVVTTQTRLVQTVGQAVEAALDGDTVLLADGVNHGLALSARGWEERAVEEPVSEGVIRGPREGFNESLRTNTMLLRRRLKSPHLKMERLVLGRRTRTVVNLVYLKDLAKPALVDEVRRRLQRIDVDGIIDTGMIEEFIEDEPGSLFPQVANTERPDRVTADLLEGRVAILADGSPFVLTVPVTFWSLLQAAEDYYERFWAGTFLRWLRFLLLLIALIGPAVYVAITTFHQEMLPTALALSIAAARDGIPFPAVVEALIMEVFFEALREAGVRLPRPVGQAVSIVGALVIGQAAVQAGLTSATVVIVIAVTGIASFAMPRFNLGIALRLTRFSLVVAAGSLGLFGLMVGLMALLVHLNALRSFGVPYLQPVAPTTFYAFKDILVRAPQWLMGHRPPAVESINRRRQAPWIRPEPGGDGS